MRIRTTFSACVFLLGLTPPVRGQAAAEFRDRPRDDRGWPTEAVHASHGMIATDEDLGSEAGVEILKRGGNAVDAAGAGGFALAGVGPAAGNNDRRGAFIDPLAEGQTNPSSLSRVASP